MLLWRRSELIGRVGIFVDSSLAGNDKAIDLICQKAVEHQEEMFRQGQQRNQEVLEDSCPGSSPELKKELGAEILRLIQEYEVTPQEAQEVLTRVSQSITFGQVPSEHVIA